MSLQWFVETNLDIEIKLKEKAGTYRTENKTIESEMHTSPECVADTWRPLGSLTRIGGFNFVYDLKELRDADTWSVAPESKTQVQCVHVLFTKNGCLPWTGVVSTEQEAICFELLDILSEFPSLGCWIKASRALYCSGENRISLGSICCV